jgi:hypothetical protein
MAPTRKAPPLLLPATDPTVVNVSSQRESNEVAVLKGLPQSVGPGGTEQPSSF